MDNSHVIIYSDGGARPNPGPGGWAALLIFGEHQKEISGGEPRTTNNRMELTAVIQALESLNEPSSVEFYTDSEYVQKGITQWIKGWIRRDWRDVKNPDLWQQLHQVTQRHMITWHWVRGHAGNEYNERVDQLATKEIEKITGESLKETKDTLSQSEVYIYLDARYAPDQRKGAWGAVIIESDSPQELYDTQTATSEYQLILEVATAALEALTSSKAVTVFTGNEYLLKGMRYWINNWIKNGWVTSSGEPVKNQVLWKRLYSVAQFHTVSWKEFPSSSNPHVKSIREKLKNSLNWG